MKLWIEPSDRKLQKICRDIGQDDLILHHTGKMFGIGCRLSSQAGIEKIIKLKQRKDKAGMIALVSDYEWFEENGIQVPMRLDPLSRQYWPGNLTLIWAQDSPLTGHISYNNKVAYRLPADPMIRRMINLLGEPIVSTSINLSNLPPESDLNRIKERYASWFDLGIIPNPKRLDPNPEPSTIIEFLDKDDPGNVAHTEDIKCIREGSIPFYEVKQAFNRPTIMFLCTANICRSPIAEKLFTYYSNKENLGYVGDSAGLLQGGHEISLNSMTLLMEKGISEAQHHISKEITPQLVSGSRLVLTMEERQRDHLRKAEPELAHKIFTLNEYVGEEGDVKDPYGSELDNYRKTYEIIEDRILRLIEKIKQESRKKG